MCPEAGQAPQECCLRVSLMPLRLNIDQVEDIFLPVVSKTCMPTQSHVFEMTALFLCLKDALFFLKDFFTSLATEVEFFSPPAQEGKFQY